MRLRIVCYIYLRQLHFNCAVAGKFDVDAEIARMRAKGKSEESIREWSELATEVRKRRNYLLLMSVASMYI